MWDSDSRQLITVKLPSLLSTIVLLLCSHRIYQFNHHEVVVIYNVLLCLRNPLFNCLQDMHTFPWFDPLLCSQIIKKLESFRLHSFLYGETMGFAWRPTGIRGTRIGKKKILIAGTGTGTGRAFSTPALRRCQA